MHDELVFTVQPPLELAEIPAAWRRDWACACVRGVPDFATIAALAADKRDATMKKTA